MHHLCPQTYLGAPECQSYTFNSAGQCTSYTGGYVMDRRVGNTQGLGALFGILAALGGPVLTPGSPTYISLTVANSVRMGLTGEDLHVGSDCVDCAAGWVP